MSRWYDATPPNPPNPDQPFPLEWVPACSSNKRPEDIPPSHIVYWARCHSGMDRVAIVAWLMREMNKQDEDDPLCGYHYRQVPA